MGDGTVSCPDVFTDDLSVKSCLCDDPQEKWRMWVCKLLLLSLIFPDDTCSCSLLDTTNIMADDILAGGHFMRHNWPSKIVDTDIKNFVSFPYNWCWEDVAVILNYNFQNHHTEYMLGNFTQVDTKELH